MGELKYVTLPLAEIDEDTPYFHPYVHLHNSQLTTLSGVICSGAEHLSGLAPCVGGSPTLHMTDLISKFILLFYGFYLTT